MPAFLAGLYIFPSMPDISDVATTNTPLVFSLTPIASPPGII